MGIGFGRLLLLSWLRDLSCFLWDGRLLCLLLDTRLRVGVVVARYGGGLGGTRVDDDARNW